MTNQAQDKLVQFAIDARGNAYAPYSKFQVGAAILADDGSIFSGVNVENCSYGLSICAERVAAASAVSAGKRKFVAMAIATSGGAPPCGACRQFLAEFGPGMKVFLIDIDQHQSLCETTLDKLLPEQFSFLTRGS